MSTTESKPAAKKNKEARWSKEQIMLLIIVVATVWAAAYATAASNKSTSALETVEEGVSQIKDMSICNRQVLGDALEVLNARTANSAPQAAANIELQRAQLEFTTTILRPESDENQRTGSLRRYVDAQNKFLELATGTKQVTEDTAYPDRGAIDRCMEDRVQRRLDRTPAP